MTALCRQSKNKEENHFSHEIFVSQKQTGKNKEVSQGESEKGFKNSIGMGHEYCLYAGNGACGQSYDGKSICFYIMEF